MQKKIKTCLYLYYLWKQYKGYIFKQNEVI
jgi:hypothetical protein